MFAIIPDVRGEVVKLQKAISIIKKKHDAFKQTKTDGHFFEIFLQGHFYKKIKQPC